MAIGTESQERPLGGECLFLVGRLQGITRRRLEHLVQRAGGKLAGRPAKSVSVVAIGHSASDRVLADGRISLPAGVSASARLMSENTLRRLLGLCSAAAEVDRSHTDSDLARVTGLGASVVSCLALFDAIEPVQGRLAWRDLVAAREVARLLGRGVALPRVIEAAAALQRAGSHLSEARLGEGPTGALVREVSGQLSELTGQMTIPLGGILQSVDDLLGAAQQAESLGAFARAESLYATALKAEPHDPVVPFNLGNVFDAQGRKAEAKVAWQIAAARDPSFAEAWYNLGAVAEDDGEAELALAQYRRATKARPDFPDACFNLALLLTRLERCAEALPLWEDLLHSGPSSDQTKTAKRAAALCRMHMQRERAAG